MPIWSIGSIESEPSVRLVRWRVLEASYVDSEEAPTRHFVGADVRDETGRVSSAIQELDIQARLGRSLSGRAYGLLGDSRFDAEAEYVWVWWCQVNQVLAWTDVTADAFPDSVPLAVPGGENGHAIEAGNRKRRKRPSRTRKTQ